MSFNAIRENKIPGKFPNLQYIRKEGLKGYTKSSGSSSATKFGINLHRFFTVQSSVSPKQEFQKWFQSHVYIIPVT